MIAKRLPAGSEEHEVSREVLRRLGALNALMGDLLLYARPPHPNIRRLDLDELLTGLIAFLRSDPAWRELTVVVEGAAGSIYATVPVAIAATSADGTVRVFAGCYLTRQIQPAIQEPPFRPLRIERARLNPADGPPDEALPAGCDGVIPR